MWTSSTRSASGLGVTSVWHLPSPRLIEPKTRTLVTPRLLGKASSSVRWASSSGGIGRSAATMRRRAPVTRHWPGLLGPKSAHQTSAMPLRDGPSGGGSLSLRPAKPRRPRFVFLSHQRTDTDAAHHSAPAPAHQCAFDASNAGVHHNSRSALPATAPDPATARPSGN